MSPENYWCSWNKDFRIIFAAYEIITSSSVTDAYDALKSACLVSPSSVRTTNLSLFCSHNTGTLLKIYVFCLVTWTFCIKSSGAFKYLNWSW